MAALDAPAPAPADAEELALLVATAVAASDVVGDIADADCSDADDCDADALEATAPLDAVAPAVADIDVLNVVGWEVDETETFVRSEDCNAATAEDCSGVMDPDGYPLPPSMPILLAMDAKLAVSIPSVAENCE